MTEPLDLTEVHDLLARTPAAIRYLVDGLSPEALVWREAPGTWNVIEILCHLADGEISDWIPRVAIIIGGGSNARFTPFDREAGFERYRGWSAPNLLNELETLRRSSLAKLAAFRIRPADLQRTGIHPELGPVTLEQLLACWVTHDHAHVSQISRVLVRHFGRRVGPWTQYFSLLNGSMANG